jgi:hypothetical protein
MRTGIAIALVLGLAAGCASDLWYKKGAGTTALAQDKAACRAETAQLAGAQASDAFEQCMTARDWYHVASAGGRSAPARKVRSVASTPARALKPATLAAPSPVAPPAAPTVATPAAPAPSLAAVETTRAAAVPEPTPESDAALALPPVSAAPEASVEDEAPAEEEIEEAELAPEPIDPKSRQFWVKFGAGPTQLAADQRSCRRELGVPDSETQPSRWGQSEDFDACMRGRGWGGGSIQATQNR